MKNWPGKIISITYHERYPSVLLSCLNWNLWCAKILWNYCTTSPLAHTEPLFNEQEILTFNVLHKYQVAQFMFNFIKGDTSEAFIDMFVYNSNVHQYDTRQSHLLHIPAVRSNLGKRNLRYEGPVIWNELQSSININCSLYSFKRQLKFIFLRC